MLGKQCAIILRRDNRVSFYNSFKMNLLQKFLFQTFMFIEQLSFKIISINFKLQNSNINF